MPPHDLLAAAGLVLRQNLFYTLVSNLLSVAVKRCRARLSVRDQDGPLVLLSYAENQEDVDKFKDYESSGGESAASSESSSQKSEPQLGKWQCKRQQPLMTAKEAMP